MNTLLSFKNWKAIFFSLAFITSLVISTKYTDPFFMPKNMFLFIFSAVFFMVMGVNLYYKKNISASLSIIDVLVLAYLFWSLFSLIHTPAISVDDIKFFILLCCTGMYFFIKPWFKLGNDKEPSAFISVTTILLIIAIIQVAWGFLQYFDVSPNLQKEFKIGGSFGNPGQYTNFLTPLMAFSFGIILFGSKGKKLAWAAFIACLLILPFTGARTAWIAALLVLLYLADKRYTLTVKAWAYLKPLWAKTLLIALVVIMAVGAGNYLYHLKKDSSSGRLFIWQVCVDMVKDKPITGFGYDRFAAAHNDYQAAYFAKHPTDQAKIDVASGVNYAFNEFIHTAVETGLPGVLILIALFVFALAAKPKSNIKDKMPFYIAKASLLAILISMLFSYPLHTIPSVLLMFFSLAVIVVNSNYNEKVYNVTDTKRKIFAILVIGSALCFFVVQLQRNKAEKQWTEAYKLMRQNQYNEAYALYTQIYEKLQYNQLFLFNYGAELSLMKRYDESIKVLKETEPRFNDSDFYIYLANGYENIGKVDAAEQAYVKAADIMPAKFFPKYKLVGIYLKTNRKKEAIDLAKNMLSMPVKVPSPTVDAIKQEMAVLVEKLSISTKDTTMH